MAKGTGLTEKPIIFSAPMVRALLDGRKTQTRRVTDLKGLRWAAGDRLWVRESWRASYSHNDYREDLGRCPRPSDIPAGSIVEYLADETRELGGVNRPSIFMPRWASRLTLIVTDVRVERLNDISEADALAEGVGPQPHHPGRWTTGDGWSSPSPAAAYKSLWNDIHGLDGWDQNPWVAAITFEAHRANIDALPAGRAALAERGGAK